MKSVKLKSVAQMCLEYGSFYADLLEFSSKEKPEEEIDFDFVFQGLALGDPSVKGRGTVASVNRLRNENAALKASIDVLKGTTSYRMARKISEAKIPFKEQLKKAFKRQ